MAKNKKNKSKMKIIVFAAIIIVVFSLIVGYFISTKDGGNISVINNQNTEESQLIDNDENNEVLSVSTESYELIDYITALGGDIKLLNSIYNDSEYLSKKDLFLINSNFKKGYYTTLYSIINDDFIKSENIEDKYKALFYIKMYGYLNGNSKDDIKEVTEYFVTNKDKIYDEYFYNYYLAYFYLESNKVNESLEVFNNILKIDSLKDEMKAEVLNQIGRVYEKMGDMTNAYDLYLQAYNLNNLALYLYNLANILTNNKSYKEAKDLLVAMKDIDNQDLLKKVLFALSSIEIELGGINPDLNKSMDYSKKLLELDENSYLSNLAIGKSYYYLNNKDNYEKIVSHLNKTVELNSNSSDAYRYLSLHYITTGDYKEARSQLEKSNNTIDADNFISDKQFYKDLNKVITIYIDIIEQDKNMLFELYLEPNLETIIKNELKRTHYGIFADIQDSDLFRAMIKDYTEMFN